MLRLRIKLTNICKWQGRRTTKYLYIAGNKCNTHLYLYIPIYNIYMYINIYMCVLHFISIQIKASKTIHKFSFTFLLAGAQPADINTPTHAHITIKVSMQVLHLNISLHFSSTLLTFNNSNTLALHLHSHDKKSPLMLAVVGYCGREVTLRLR